MKTLSISVTQFKSITIDDCLNYENVHTRLESLVKSYIETYLKKIQDNNLTTDSNIKEFLQHMLLRISGNNTWIQLSTEYDLDQHYLYIVIRKHLFLIKPDVTY